MTDTLALAIIGHLVGDYLSPFQTDWSAANKKKHWFPCLVHSSGWTLCVCLFTGWWTLPALLTLFVTHYVQDRTMMVTAWMRLAGQGNFANAPLGPWSVIVVDNVFHLLVITAVWRFL
jgi:hypothetical protein